jgi:hypothetical protein
MVAIMALVQRLYVDGTIEADTLVLHTGAPAHEQTGRSA